MTTVPFCFILSDPTTLSKADEQQRRSQALSHAAVVAYTRRNPSSDAWIEVDATKRKSKLVSRRKESPCGTSSEHRKRTERPLTKPQPNPTRILRVRNGPSAPQISRDHLPLDRTIYEELDPFLKPASALSRHERNVLHQYLLITPARIYGTQPGALFCVVRDINVPQIQTNRLWLQWTLLYAERFALPDNPQRAVTLLARRAKIYAYINELMADTTTRSSDATISGLTFGSLIEWQLGSLELARQHLGFVRHNLLPQRTGVQVPSFLVGVTTYVGLLSVGLGHHAFRDWPSAIAGVERFLAITTSMQQHSTTVSVEGTKTVMSLETPESRPSALSRNYVASCSRALGTSSMLYKLLLPRRDRKDAVLDFHQLALLWVLNKILFELRDDLKMAAELLDTLHRYVESHDSPSPFDPRIPRRSAFVAGSDLKPFTVNAMLGHISGTYLPKVDPGAVDWTAKTETQHIRPLLRFWENIDMVELLRLLPENSKANMVEQLSGWLIGPQPEEKVIALGPDQLEELAEEMKCAWLVQRSNVDAFSTISR